MASFNLTSGTTTTAQTLLTGETGRVGAGAVLSTGSNFAIGLSGNFVGTVAAPTVVNDGSISSSTRVFTPSNVTGTIYIVNTGSMLTSGSVAADFSSGVNTATIVLDNSGSISGIFAMSQGNDMLVMRNGASMVSANGAAGVDWLNYAAITGAGVSVTLGSSATGFTGSVTGFENVYGSNQGDTITGDTNNNVLVGLDGDDTLNGGNGNDTLWGGTGNDTLQGGAGNDVLYGGEGTDSLAGGANDDIYQVTDGTDVVVEQSAAGTDAVFVTVSWTVTSDNIEAVYALGSGLSITGQSTVDVLVADATTGSTLLGQDGDDTLWGQAGADSLSGGAGNDVLRGGAANDTLAGGAGDDKLVGGAGADTFLIDPLAAFGTDEIFDFNKAEGDVLRFVGQSQPVTIQVIDGNTQLVMAQGMVNLYGVTGLTQDDLVFG